MLRSVDLGIWADPHVIADHRKAGRPTVLLAVDEMSSTQRHTMQKRHVAADLHPWVQQSRRERGTA